LKYDFSLSKEPSKPESIKLKFPYMLPFIEYDMFKNFMDVFK